MFKNYKPHRLLKLCTFSFVLGNPEFNLILNFLMIVKFHWNYDFNISTKLQIFTHIVIGLMKNSNLELRRALHLKLFNVVLFNSYSNTYIYKTFNTNLIHLLLRISWDWSVYNSINLRVCWKKNKLKLPHSIDQSNAFHLLLQLRDVTLIDIKRMTVDMYQEYT